MSGLSREEMISRMSEIRRQMADVVDYASFGGDQIKYRSMSDLQAAYDALAADLAAAEGRRPRRVTRAVFARR